MATAALAMAIQGTLCCDTVLPAAGDESARGGKRPLAERAGGCRVPHRRAKAYLADAFLFGTVTQYKPYDPPVLGLKLRMLSARDRQRHLGRGSVYQRARAGRARLAEAYFQNSGLKDRLYGPELVLMSPKLFAEFVAAQVVRPLGEQLQRTRNLASAEPAH